MTQEINSKTLIPLLTVSPPPFVHTKNTISRLSVLWAISLVPAIVLSLIVYDVMALRVIALAIAAAMLTEYLCCKLIKKANTLYDNTAMLTGLLFAMTVPPGVPWWLVVTGSVVSISLGKQVFGGLGANPVCSPLLGWIVVSISWPELMDANSVMLSSVFVEPLLKLKFFGVDSIPQKEYWHLVFGKQLGGLGTVYIAGLAIGGLFLIIKRAVRILPIISYFLSVLVFGSLLWMYSPNNFITPELYFLTGSTVFAGFYLVTDYSSTPVTPTGLVLFGIIAGALTVLIRSFSVYSDGALFAVLLSNLITPLLDFRGLKPFGKRS